MELRALNDFLVIARGENITRAAEQLHVSPPTLSRQSADLEEVPGVKLCYRMTGCMCIYALRTSKSTRTPANITSTEQINVPLYFFIISFII